MELPAFFSAPLVQVLGWTVVHSLWQMLIVFAVFKAGAWYWSRNSRAAYRWALACMSAMFLWSMLTFSAEYNRIQEIQTVHLQVVEEAAALAAAPAEPAQVFVNPAPPSLEDRVWGWLDRYACWFGWAWCLGALVPALRMGGGYWLSRRLRRRGLQLPDLQYIDLCKSLAARTGIKRVVQLFESQYVTEPVTLGFLKPVILFPVGLMLELNPAQIEVLLLHELAHIRRYDYIVNIVQMLLELCFFYHPLFWFMSREARTQREFCCDDLVLAHIQNPLLYAKTLTNLKLSTVKHLNSFAMKTTGHHSFSARIVRIAGITPKNSNRSNVLTLFLLFGMLSVALMRPAESVAAIDAFFDLGLVQKNEQVQMNADSVVPVPRKVVKPVQKPMPVSAETGAEPGSEKPGNVAVELNKMNVFYVGVDNPVDVAAVAVPSGRLSVKLKGEGKITGAKGSYIATFSNPGSVELEVYDGQKLLVSKPYRVKRIPDPKPYFGGHSTGKITREQLMELHSVEAVLQNFDFDVVCTITGYEVTVLPKDQDPTTYTIKGSELNSYVLELIASLVPGSSVFIDDIFAKCPGDVEPRNLGGLSFKIKE